MVRSFQQIVVNFGIPHTREDKYYALCSQMLPLHVRPNATHTIPNTQIINLHCVQTWARVFRFYPEYSCTCVCSGLRSIHSNAAIMHISFWRYDLIHICTVLAFSFLTNIRFNENKKTTCIFLTFANFVCKLQAFVFI